jgi:transcriptional regulator with XRE-family HTH domain
LNKKFLTYRRKSAKDERMKNGTEIRLARKRMRLRQQQMAKLCDMRPETLSRVELGKMPELPPRLALLVALISRDEASLQFAMDFMGVE